LAGLSWESEFGNEMRKSLGADIFGVPASIAPWIRAASDALTMAMTILYGLEKLSGDDAWTRKHTLTVHVSPLFLLFTGCFPILSDKRSSVPTFYTSPAPPSLKKSSIAFPM
jgi:hypothetical protein